MSKHPAITFLQTLDPRPDATFNIEHFTDVPKGSEKPNPDPLLRRYPNLTQTEVEALIPKLAAINEKGAGIFVARNQCQGQRKAAAVTKVRGPHADMDGVTPEQLEVLSKLIPPSIVVQSSSPSRFQLYWQLSDGEVITPDEVKAINQRLVDFGADSAAVDASRLLRLPGFKHMKYRADGITPVVNASYTGLEYTCTEIFEKLSPRDFGAKRKAPKKVTHETNPITIATEFKSIEVAVAQKHPHLWNGQWQSAVTRDGVIGYPSQSEADMALAGHIAREFRTQQAVTEDMFSGVESVFNCSALAQSTKWTTRPDYRASTIQRAIDGLSQLSPNSGTNLQLESHGDIRNARAFATMAVDKFIYVTSRDKWLEWNSDERWQLCEKDEHVAFAKNCCAEILASASQVFRQDQERGRKLMHDAMNAHNLPRINAMLKLSVSEPNMSVTDKSLDADSMQLGVTNGVVDLRKGQHLFNQPKLLVTRYCNANFVEDEPCPQWIVFLNQIFEHDDETIESVQRLLGYTLTGLVTEEVLVICYGFGSNGKSVFSNVIHSILGGYATTAPPSLLTARRPEDTSPRNDLASLAGARYVSINELQAGDRLDEQVVKMLAGREPISARFLHREYFEYMPSFTAWLRTNHKPIITGEDDGIWRRLVVLKFGRKFSEVEKDPNLESKLLEERDGILQWMLEGTRMYLKDGLKLSPRIRAEIASYRKDSDLLGEFMADVLEVDPAKKINQQTAYQEWSNWCKTNGFRVSSKKSFTQRLAERGFPEGRSGGNRFYVGIKMRSPASSSQGGVGGIPGDLPNSANIDSHEEKTRNSENPALPALDAPETCEGVQ
jgi:putative DNA primase/helicase